MKNIFILLVIWLMPLAAQAEAIRSFVSDITLSQDGSFIVKETIVYDFESEERHGIFRVIPTAHPQESGQLLNERIIEVEVLAVTMDGGTVPFSLNRNLGELDIKIGDPDKTINGEHTYIINYKVRGGLSYYNSGEAELYWNVTGNGWEVPIESAKAHVYDLGGITLLEAECYFGTFGDDNECDVSRSDNMITFGDVSLLPQEGMTVAQALDPQKVDKLIVENLSLWPIWLVGALLWLIALVWFLCRHFLEHRTGASIIAQYEPYHDFKPMYTGLLFDGRIDPHDITAGIVYLAEQGFFKIKRIGRKVLLLIEVDDYEITLLRPYSEVETDFQKQIFTLLFDSEATVGSTVVLSELAKDMAKQKENYKVLNALHEAAGKDLVAQGFFEYHWLKLIQMAVLLFIGLAALLLINAMVGAEMTSPLVISLVIIVISLIALALAYRRRTRKGYEALDYLKGFKEFLSVTDKERFKFHNAPQKSPEQFMEYLPYAIAFGVEKEWAAAFKDITIPEPDWYDGQGSTFSALYLSQSLGAFGNSVTSASGASPASSGGGSSGGGAGGGGGGSW